LFTALNITVFAGVDDTEPQRRKPNDANAHGHVIDARNGEHIPFATVSVEGTTIGTTTDATGHFYLKNLPEGELTILAESVGYKALRRKIVARSGKSVEVNFEMSEETLSMDAVVVSATRNETNKKSTAVVVNVASAKLFETTASTNLAESMKFQSGLRVENNCGNCGTMQLRINGLEGQYSQILLDSAPIFSSLAAVYGLEQLPVAMIERVEVIRGGGSALFGSNAIGGVVNIITKEPLRNSLTVSNLTDIIEDGTAEYNTSLNGSFVSDDNRAGIYLFGMIKNRAAYDRNGDGFSDIPQVKSETVGFRGYYKTSIRSKLTAEYHHIHEFRRGGDALDLPPHMAEIAEQIEHDIDGGSLRFDAFSADSRHRGNVYASAQRISRDSYYGTGKDPDAYGKTSDLTAVVGAQYTYSFDKCLFMPAQLTLGGEYTYNDLDDHSIGFDRKLLQTVHTTGAFVQNEWRSDKFNIIVGGRLDKHSMIDKPIFSPRANIRYSPNENVGLRLSYSSGYRAPQAYNEDLHIDALNNQSAVIVLDPDLKPEYSHSLSGSADLYRTFGSVQTNLLVEGFYTDLDDVFTLTKAGEDEAGNIVKMRRNASGATVAGITSELKIGISNAFEVQLGYTFQRSRYDEPERWSDDAEPQRRMFRTPDHYGYLTASADITRNFRASLFGNYTGRMLVQHNAGWIERDTDRLTPAFWDMGLRFSYLFRLTNVISMQLDAGVKNIFDSYQSDLDFGPSKDSVYIYGPSLPRTYFVGLKFTM
jgi:outer membrane receptor for ferrienterochelin and colicins